MQGQTDGQMNRRTHGRHNAMTIAHWPVELKTLPVKNLKIWPTICESEFVVCKLPFIWIRFIFVEFVEDNEFNTLFWKIMQDLCKKRMK